MKTVSVRELNENISRTLQDARRQPVLVRNADRPAVWMVGADELARLVDRGSGDPALYHHVLELIAVDLFDHGVLTITQAARLAGMSVGAFSEACDRLGVPVLRESDRSVAEQIDTFEEWLKAADAAGT